MRTILYAITYVGLAAAGFFGTTLCCQQADPDKTHVDAAAARTIDRRRSDAEDEPRVYRCRVYHIMTMGDMCYWYKAECPSGTGWSSEINTCDAPFGPCCGPPACAHCQDSSRDHAERNPLGQSGVSLITARATVSVGATEKIFRNCIIEFPDPRSTTGATITAHFVLLYSRPYKDDAGNKHTQAAFGVGRQIRTNEPPEDVSEYMSTPELDPDNPKFVTFEWTEFPFADVRCVVALAKD